MADAPNTGSTPDTANAGTPPAGAPPAGTPPAGSPPAGTPPESSAPPASTPPADWRTGLSDDLKAYVETKQFKDPAAALESYRNAEKLLGVPAERVLKLPEKLEGMKDLLPIMDRLGRPKEANGYEFKPAVEGQVLDEKLTAWAKPVLHELGLTKAQGEGLVQKWNELAANSSKAEIDSYKVELSNQQQALQKEWGSAHEQNTRQAEGAARALGVTPETMAQIGVVLGHGGMMKMFQNIGAKIGEDSFVGGGSNGGGMGAIPPAQAQAQIQELINSKEFGAKLQAKEPEAMKKWDYLHRMAYPEAAPK